MQQQQPQQQQQQQQHRKSKKQPAASMDADDAKRLADMKAGRCFECGKVGHRVVVCHSKKRDTTVSDTRSDSRYTIESKKEEKAYTSESKGKPSHYALFMQEFMELDDSVPPPPPKREKPLMHELLKCVYVYGGGCCTLHTHSFKTTHTPQNSKLP